MTAALHMAVHPFHSYNLAGVWSVSTEDQKVFNMRLPGTLDENNIGHRDSREPFKDPAVTEEQPSTVLVDDILLQETTFVTEELLQEGDQTILDRFRRNLTYQGKVRAYKMFTFEEKPGKRLFFEMERTRECTLLIDGEEINAFTAPSLVSPQIFEVTGRLNGSHMITFVMDNACTEFPKEVLESNMCSDKTQTNWNGTLGFLRIREEEETFADRVFTETNETGLTVFLEINALSAGTHFLRLSSPVFEEEYERTVSVKEGANGFKLSGIVLKDEALRWNEKSGALYSLTVTLDGTQKEVSFGIVDKKVSEDGTFLINGQPLFLRMETNRGLFPEFFYPPMDEDSWDDIFALYESYGVNSVYFEHWCPPEAAFVCADRRGMLLFPSVSVGDTENTHDYYMTELLQIRRLYGGHPSCCLGLFADLSMETVTGTTMLPDFSEIDLFSAHLRPDNLIRMREHVKEQRLLTKWSQAVETSGNTAFRLLKEKIGEAYLHGAKGIRLNALQDCVSGTEKFSGLVNSHLRQKPYAFARPKNLLAVFGPLSVIVSPGHRSFEAGETVEAEVHIVNHSGGPVEGTPAYKVLNGPETVSEGKLPLFHSENGEILSAGMIVIPTGDGLIGDREPQRLDIRVTFLRTVCEEHVFVYPSTIPVCPETVYECETIDEVAKEFLNLGGNVFLTPNVPEHPFELPQILADTSNPLIYRFPADDGDPEAFGAFLSGTMIPLRKNERPILMKFNAAGYEAPEGCLFEYACRNGSVLLSTMNLKKKMDLPEVREFVAAIYDYMGSYEFSPRDEIRLEDLSALVESIREA